MRCPNCGSEQPAGAHFCDQCGTPLGTAAAPASQPYSNQPAPVSGAESAPTPPPPASSPNPGGSPICAVCGATNIPGEVFCENCGASLVPTAAETPVSAGSASAPVYTAPPPQTSPPPQPAAQQSQPAAPPPPQPITTAPLNPRLVVVDTSAEIPLPSKPEMVIGREDPVSNSFPDVDMTPHGGMDKGVSRRHVKLHKSGDRFSIEDLGSVNGSYLNREKLTPNQLVLLNPGDVISLGRLAVRFEK